MANNHTTLVSLFSDIANSIRSKTGGSTNIVADNFPNAINNIHNDATITSNSQLLSGITAYGPNGKFTGNIVTVTHPNPTISTATFNTNSLNVEIQATHTQNSGLVVGSTTTATTNVPITSGTVVASVTSHTVTTPTITVSHSGNIATIGTTTKPSGTAGTNYYQIGFSNSVTNGNTNARSYGNISVNGYVTTANNTASAWSNKTISATVTQPATYYINKGNLTESNISGASYLETTGDYGFRATVVVPEGYHVGETVVKNFTTGIFPAPESKGTANRMLTGYSLYDEDGRLITGSMPNQGAQNSTISTQGGTYTIPEGYHDGNGVVTASIGSGAYSATQVTAVGVTPSVGGTITDIATTTAPTGTDGTDFYTINPGASVTNGNARARINTAGYLGAGNKYVNITGSVGTGTNYYIPKSVSTNSSSVSGKTVTVTVTVPAGYNPGETVTVSNSVATATHPNPSINKATFNTTSGNVEITANHVQSTGYVTGGTTSASTNVAIGMASINAPSGSAKQSKPGLSFNASNGVVTATVAATSGTAYANVTGAGYTAAGAKSGTFTMNAADSNTINVGLGSRTAGIQAFISAGSVTNASNHAVNASDNVKLTTEANGRYRINANAKATTTAGYIAAGTSYDTAGATYINKATASITNQTLTGTITGTAASATAGTASVTFSNITTQTTATNYKITYNTTGGSASANSGTITGGSKTAYANVTEGYTPSTISAAATATVSNVSAVTKSATGASNNGIVYLKAATATNGSASGSATVSASGANASTSITGMETTTTNTGFIVSASANATSGAITALTKTATASVTDGYSNTGASATATATVSAVAAKTASNSNTQYIKAATISDFSAKYKAQSKPTFSINTTTGIITASVAATTQAIYRNVTTGYVGTANTTGITFTMNASSNTYNAIAGLGSASRSASIDGIAIAGLVINASNNAVNSSDAPTLAFTTAANGYYRININTVSTTTAGYISAGSTSNLNPSIYVPKGSITAQANSVTVSGKTVTYNINTVITAGYQTAGTYWVNGTKDVATGTLAAGSASVLNNSNGNIRYYRNVSAAGYIAANTTAYYLQLNTKGGSTTYVNGTGATLVNAGQFVTGAIIAKAANCTYDSNNTRLIIPTGLITV